MPTAGVGSKAGAAAGALGVRGMAARVILPGELVCWLGGGLLAIGAAAGACCAIAGRDGVRLGTTGRELTGANCCSGAASLGAFVAGVPVVAVLPRGVSACGAKFMVAAPLGRRTPSIPAEREPPADCEATLGARRACSSDCS